MSQQKIEIIYNIFNKNNCAYKGKGKGKGKDFLVVSLVRCLLKLVNLNIVVPILKSIIFCAKLYN